MLIGKTIFVKFEQLKKQNFGISVIDKGIITFRRFIHPENAPSPI